jgi:hypothetical protein
MIVLGFDWDDCGQVKIKEKPTLSCNRGGRYLAHSSKTRQPEKSSASNINEHLSDARNSLRPVISGTEAVIHTCCLTDRFDRK